MRLLGSPPQQSESKGEAFRQNRRTFVPPTYTFYI